MPCVAPNFVEGFPGGVQYTACSTLHSVPTEMGHQREARQKEGNSDWEVAQCVQGTVHDTICPGEDLKAVVARN